MSVAESIRLARMTPKKRTALDPMTREQWVRTSAEIVSLDPVFRRLQSEGLVTEGAAVTLSGSHLTRSDRAWVLDGAPRFSGPGDLAVSVLRQCHRVAKTLEADGL